MSGRAKTRTASDRLKSRLAAEAIRDGKIRVPAACPECGSSSLSEDAGTRSLTCIACGRPTSHDAVHQLRRRVMRKIIADGIDIPQAVEFGLLNATGAKTRT